MSLERPYPSSRFGSRSAEADSPSREGVPRYYLPFNGSAGQSASDNQTLISQLLNSRKPIEASPSADDLSGPGRSSTATQVPSNPPRSRVLVGSSVRAKLGQTIGWKSGSSAVLNNSTNDQIVAQAKSLCGRYLRSRMRDAPAIIQKKLSFQRLKSVSNLAATDDTLLDVLDEIRLLCRHLEVSNPELFGSLVENVGLRSLPSTERAVKGLLTAVVSELFTGGEVSWGRLAAMFAVTGALALDCVRANKPELVLGLVETTGRNVDCHAATWIARQGGWEALTDCFRNKPGYSSSAIASFFLVIVCCSCIGVFTAHVLSIQFKLQQAFFPAIS